MNEPKDIAEAEVHLAIAFKQVAGIRTKVTALARDENDRVVICVACPGDKLLEMIRIESFIVENGDSVRHRSRVKDGNTFLVYNMERKKSRA